MVAEITLRLLTPSSKHHQIPKGAERDDLWDQVDDFKWLRSEKSPHWSASRCAEGTDDRWKELAGKGVGEIEPKQVLQDLLEKTG